MDAVHITRCFPCDVAQGGDVALCLSALGLHLCDTALRLDQNFARRAVRVARVKTFNAVRAQSIAGVFNFARRDGDQFGDQFFDVHVTRLSMLLFWPRRLP